MHLFYPSKRGIKYAKIMQRSAHAVHNSNFAGKCNKPNLDVEKQQLPAIYPFLRLKANWNFAPKMYSKKQYAIGITRSHTCDAR